MAIPDYIAWTSDEVGITASESGAYVGKKKRKHMTFDGLRSHMKGR
jgi:hypothetical protein